MTDKKPDPVQAELEALRDENRQLRMGIQMIIDSPPLYLGMTYTMSIRLLSERLQKLLDIGGA